MLKLRSTQTYVRSSGGKGGTERTGLSSTAPTSSHAAESSVRTCHAYIWGIMSNKLTGSQDKAEMRITKFVTFELSYSRLRQHISQRSKEDLSLQKQSLRSILPRDNSRMGRERRKIRRQNGGEC